MVGKKREDTPAQQSMKFFFFNGSKEGRFKGRPRINLPWKLNDDLERYSNSGMKLKTNKDLEEWRELAKGKRT